MSWSEAVIKGETSFLEPMLTKMGARQRRGLWSLWQDARPLGVTPSRESKAICMSVDKNGWGLWRNFIGTVNAGAD